MMHTEIAQELVAVARELVGYQEEGLAKKIPHLNGWKHRRGGNPRLPRRSQYSLDTVAGRYVIQPTEGGVSLTFKGEEVSSHNDAKEAVKAARSHFRKQKTSRVASGFGLIRALLKIRPGKRATLSFTNERSGATLYAHIWFDDNVAQDDFGNDVEDSGEWQVVISPDESWMSSKELARNEFRYADPKMRDDVARWAADWTGKQLKRLLRRM